MVNKKKIVGVVLIILACSFALASSKQFNITHVFDTLTEAHGFKSNDLGNEPSSILLLLQGVKQIVLGLTMILHSLLVFLYRTTALMYVVASHFHSACEFVVGMGAYLLMEGLMLAISVLKASVFLVCDMLRVVFQASDYVIRKILPVIITTLPHHISHPLARLLLTVDWSEPKPLVRWILRPVLFYTTGYFTFHLIINLPSILLHFLSRMLYLLRRSTIDVAHLYGWDTQQAQALSNTLQTMRHWGTAAQHAENANQRARQAFLAAQNQPPEQSRLRAIASRIRQAAASVADGRRRFQITASDRDSSSSSMLQRRRHRSLRRSGSNVQDELSALCIICCEKDKSHALFPCGHLCLCEGCSGQVDACPLCRNRITRTQRIYQ